MTIELGTKAFPAISPMKALTADISFLEQVSDDSAWAAGEKFDGYREVLYLGERHNELLSSLGNSHIDRVPQFKVVVPELAGTVLDTEGMSPTRMREDNASCFKAFPESSIPWQDEYGLAFLVAFDIMRYKGADMTQTPFAARRLMLQQVVTSMKRHTFWSELIRYEVLIHHDKLGYYNQIVARTQFEGHEGVMLKRMDALYSPGRRSKAWMKVKREEDFVCTITGFTSGTGKYSDMIGSVAFEGDGVSGTAGGMDDDVRAHMTIHPEFYIGRKAIIRAQAKTRLDALTSPRYKGLVEEA